MNSMRYAETNPLYQSKILPIIQRAETEIKTLVLVAFLYMQPKTMLLASILAVINRVKAELPTEFGDLSAYTNGLIASADKMILEGYNKPQLAFNIAKRELERTAPSPINITSPKQLNEIIKDKRDLWAEAKGSPNVTDYPRVLKQQINKLSEMDVVAVEPGKKPISIWQKAELDTRYEHQMDMVQKAKDSGHDLWYISSHPNCSKRCQVWQGSLVSISKRAAAPSYTADKKGIHYRKSSFIVGREGKMPIYSLDSIMDCTDIYGYNNNIICGFNCRHRLIKYEPGLSKPTEYTDKEISEQRDIELQIRAMERKIRLLKTKEHLYNKSGDKKTAKAYRSQWKTLFEFYKRFCNKHGYAWNEYRTKIY